MEDTPCIKLVAIPQVDLGELPLDLPAADGINNGGYKVPALTGDWRTGVWLQTTHQYSPIDLLVCGLEAIRCDLRVTSLVSFFDRNRNGVPSESKVYLSVKRLGKVSSESIAYFKHIVTCDEDSELLRVLVKNAPLTFKWVTIWKQAH